MSEPTSDTPKTDAAAFDSFDGMVDVIDADFARELERENAKLRAALVTCRREHAEQAEAWGHPDHCDPDHRDYHRKWEAFCAQSAL